MPALEDRKTVEKVQMIAVSVEIEAIHTLEERLAELLHLKPQWERLLVAESGGRCSIGLPLAAKVTADSAENQARHLFSLLTVLGVGMPEGPALVRRAEFPKPSIRPLRAPESTWKGPGSSEPDELD